MTKQALQDGGHTYLSCSDCQAWLYEIWITRPGEQSSWKVKATCPYCGDGSFVEEIKGGFHHGPAYTQNPDDPDDQKLATVLERVEQESDLFIFHLKKASSSGKPIRRHPG